MPISSRVTAVTPRNAASRPKTIAAGDVDDRRGRLLADRADDPLDGVGELGGPVRIGQGVPGHAAEHNPRPSAAFPDGAVGQGRGARATTTQSPTPAGDGLVRRVDRTPRRRPASPSTTYDGRADERARRSSVARGVSAPRRRAPWPRTRRAPRRASTGARSPPAAGCRPSSAAAAVRRRRPPRGLAAPASASSAPRSSRRRRRGGGQLAGRSRRLRRRRDMLGGRCRPSRCVVVVAAAAGGHDRRRRR